MRNGQSSRIREATDISHDVRYRAAIYGEYVRTSSLLADGSRAQSLNIVNETLVSR